MTRKKEKLNTEEITEVIETAEVQTLVEPKPLKNKTTEPKKDLKLISDLEVAKKMVNIYSSAQSRNLEFNLSFEYVKKLLEHNNCYYTNVEFTEDGPYARSFDRVDNDKGYVIGNVVACTVDINGKKNNLSLDEIVCLYKKLSYLKK